MNNKDQSAKGAIYAASERAYLCKVQSLPPLDWLQTNSVTGLVSGRHRSTENPIEIVGLAEYRIKGMKKPTPCLERFDQLVLDLNLTWQMFDDLYKPGDNYPIFNRTGPIFWNQLQSYLLDTITMAIARFFDQPMMGKQQNLSLLTVIELEEVSQIRSTLKQREETLRNIYVKGIQPWRHKRISHTDLNTVMSVTCLPNLPFSDIKTLVAGISEFAREINVQIHEFDQSYKVGTTQWVPQVMAYLRLGIQKKDEQLQSLSETIKNLTQ